MDNFFTNWRDAMTRAIDKSGVTKRGGALQPSARKADIVNEMVDELYEPYKGGPTKSEVANRLMRDNDAFVKLAEFHHDLGRGTRYDKDPNFDTELYRRSTINKTMQFPNTLMGNNAMSQTNPLFASRRLSDGSQYVYNADNLLASREEKRKRATNLIKDMWK